MKDCMQKLEIACFTSAHVPRATTQSHGHTLAAREAGKCSLTGWPGKEEMGHSQTAWV